MTKNNNIAISLILSKYINNNMQIELKKMSREILSPLNKIAINEKIAKEIY